MVVAGERMYYSPMVRFLSFSEPISVDCELHKYFSVFFFFFPPPLVGTEWLKPDEIGFFPSLGQLSHDNTLPG